MKTRSIRSHRKNEPFLFTKSVTGSHSVTEFFSHPAEVHTATLSRVYDEYSSDLNEDWTFVGESEDWELTMKTSTAV